MSGSKSFVRKNALQTQVGLTRNRTEHESKNMRFRSRATSVEKRRDIAIASLDSWYRPDFSCQAILRPSRFQKPFRASATLH